MGKLCGKLFKILSILIICFSLVVKCKENFMDGTQIREARSVSSFFNGFGSKTDPSQSNPLIVIKFRMPAGMSGGGTKSKSKKPAVAIADRPSGFAFGPAPLHLHKAMAGPVIIQQIPAASILKQPQQQQQIFFKASPPPKIFTKAPPNYRPLQIKAVTNPHNNVYQNYQSEDPFNSFKFNYGQQQQQQQQQPPPSKIQTFELQMEGPKFNYQPSSSEYDETPTVDDYSKKLNMNLNKNNFPAYTMTAQFQGQKVPVLYMPVFMPMTVPVASKTGVKNFGPTASPSPSPFYSHNSSPTSSPLYSHYPSPTSSPFYAHSSTPFYSHSSNPPTSSTSFTSTSQNGGHKFLRAGENFMGKMTSYMKNFLPGRKTHEGHPKWSPSSSSSIRSWRSRLPKISFGKAVISPSTPKIVEHNHSIELF